MENTDQIREEIRFLFETIKKQALQYNAAFENFSLMKSQFERMVKEISDFQGNMTEDISKKSNQFDTKMTDFFQYISREYDSLKKEYRLVKNLNILNEQQENLVEQLRDFLSQSENKFDTLFSNVEEYRKDIKNIHSKAKNDSEKTLNDMISSFKDKIDSSVEDKTEDIKNDLIFRQRRIEGILKNLEKEVKDLQREFTINKNHFIELVEKLNFKIDNEDPQAKQDNKSLIDRLDIRLEEISQIVNVFENEIESLKNETPETTSSSEGIITNETDNSLILNLRTKVTELGIDVNEYDKRAKTAYIIAFMSIVFSLIAILITFV